MTEEHTVTKELYDEQVRREEAYVDLIMGRREQDLSKGEVLEVTPIKKVINGAVPFTAQRWRGVCKGVIDGDVQRVLTLLQTTTFPAIQLQSNYQQLFAPILAWFLRGNSPGRIEAEAGAGTTYADDAVLAVLGTIVKEAILSEAKQSRDIAGAAKNKYSRTLTQVIKEVEDSLRIVIIGQWLSEFQSPKAVRNLARSIVGDNSWRHGNKLSNTATLIVAQVIPQIEAWRRGEKHLDNTKGERQDPNDEKFKGKLVVHTFRDNGEQRRMEIKPPDEAAIACLRNVVYDLQDLKASAPPITMVATAMLCCMMAEFPWFDVVKAKSKRSKHVTRYLVLTDEAIDELTKDIPRWLRMVPQVEPMLIPPVDGGYVTSTDNQRVTNKGAIDGYGTVAEGTDHWKLLCEFMAGTPWVIVKDHLHLFSDEGGETRWAGGKALDAEDEAHLAAYSKLKQKRFYLPTRVDFRGRCYYRTHPVTAQGSDLQKSLLAFTPRPKREMNAEEKAAIALHITNLYGNGYDKATMEQRLRWFENDLNFHWSNGQRELIHKADKPAQFQSMMTLLKSGAWEQIPIQIDGTCNGIQHLSAMFLDEKAGPLVNLVDHEKPADIYGEVAKKLWERLMAMKHPAPWVGRMVALFAEKSIDRKFCKSTVMTLPYGVTRQGAEEQVIKAATGLVSLATLSLWGECLELNAKIHDEWQWRLDDDAIANGYKAFADRATMDDISTHPLFRLDCRKLSTLLWETIEETIPKPMQAMEAFKKIGSSIGDHVFEWQTAPGDVPFWVVQSKAKTHSRQLKMRGFHLPAVARSMSLRVRSNDIDKGSHSSGIVANFIHSHDAEHLTRTLRFLPQGTAFAANHDSFWTRASSARQLNAACREAFCDKYGAQPSTHPLEQPCRVVNPRTGQVEGAWDSLRAMAEEVGAPLPDPGTLDIHEVLNSTWFFS